MVKSAVKASTVNRSTAKATSTVLPRRLEATARHLAYLNYMPLLSNDFFQAGMVGRICQRMLACLVHLLVCYIAHISSHSLNITSTRWMSLQSRFIMLFSFDHCCASLREFMARHHAGEDHITLPLAHAPVIFLVVYAVLTHACSAFMSFGARITH